MKKKLLALLISVICLSACNHSSSNSPTDTSASREAAPNKNQVVESEEDLAFDYLTLAITESNKMTDIRTNTERNAGSTENRIRLMTEEKAQMLRSKEKMEKASVPPSCLQAHSAQMKLYEIYDKFLSESLEFLDEEVENVEHLRLDGHESVPVHQPALANIERE